MERLEYFRRFRDVAREIKKIVSKYVEARVYVFGSVVRGDYSIGLSDIDIALVSDEFRDRSKRLMIYDILFDKYFDSPIEFHILTPERWRLYLNFIGDDYIEIE